jgi:hypothetical protein
MNTLELHKLYLKRLQTNIENLEETISKGNVDTFDKYKDLVGELRGLKRARETFKEAFSDVNKGLIVEDDEQNDEEGWTTIES